MRLYCWTKGTTTWQRISFLYLTAVKVPSNTTNGDLTPWDIPLQTITDRPPNLFTSLTYASATIWTKKVKKTHLHCLIGNILMTCAANQAIRRVCCGRVRGRLTHGRLHCRPASRNRFLTVLWWTWQLWLPIRLLAVSVTVTYRLRRWARRTALSWHRVVTRGRPVRDRSARLPVSTTN